MARFSALSEDFLKDQRATAWASPALPIPRIVEFGEAFGGYYAISERAHGQFLDLLDGPALERALPSLFAALDVMREADLSDSRGFGIWNASGNGPNATWHEALLSVAHDLPSGRTHGWRLRLEGSAIGAAPFEEGFAALQRLLPLCPEGRHVIHSDLLNFNVLIGDDGVSAIIDWGSSLYGDFVYDVAWLTFWQPWYTAWADVDIAAAARDHYARICLDVPNFAERLRCYEVYIGLDGIAYSAWKQRWDNVDWTARRLLDVARAAIQ